MDERFLYYLVATDQLDEFLGNKVDPIKKLSKAEKAELKDLARDYNNGDITDEDVCSKLSDMELYSKVEYDDLYNIFKDML